MIVTNPSKGITQEVKREYEVDEEESVFYVEKSTSLIYEVRFFPDFALVRPAHPEYSSCLERMNLLDFADKFDEYWGDPQPLRDFLWGSGIHSIEIKYKDD